MGETPWAFSYTAPMHRDSLLTLLDDYARRHTDESTTTAWFIDFVTANPRCFERDLRYGHITGSAWLVDGRGERVLLTHHRKLGRWLQLGGHSDGNPRTLEVAIREATEESGLRVRPLADTVFDLDVHEIPARNADPAHWHFDVRFALQVVGSEDFRVSGESLDLAWVPIDQLDAVTGEESVLRMARKWRTGSARV
jgi:8-oxo-dGTP pyrophosphatase MutT (NUDIX family)